MGFGPVLVVDDEVDLLELVEFNLRREGFQTVTATTGEEAIRMAGLHAPSLIVLDLMLPDLSGTEVCRRLRGNEGTRDTPIIMLTARGEEIDRVVGFEVGADDYIVKASFSMRELILRVRAVLRRHAPRTEKVEATVADGVRFGRLRIDEAAHRVWIDGVEVALTVTEFRLLWILASRAGRVQSRGTLLEDVWDMPRGLNTRTVDTHVKRLREKLGAVAAHIETVRGVGYRFSPTPQRS